MANLRLATPTWDRISNQITAAIDAARAGRGKINIYTGPQPARGDMAITAQLLLATLEFSHPSFTRSVAGQIEANEITPGNGVARGRAAWARLTDGAGNAVTDCDVGTVEATIILNDVEIIPGGPVWIDSFTIGPR